MDLFRALIRLFSPAPTPTPRRRSRPRPVPRPASRDDAPTPAGRSAELRAHGQPAHARRAAAVNARACRDGGTVLRGKVYVIDGDTVVIQKTRIRLAGIDAPELEHPWGKKSKWALHAMTKGQIVTAHVSEEMSHDRCVATCTLADGTDLAAELVRQGLAIDWPKFSGGKYAALEPEGVRERLWRADNRQKGKWPC